MAITSSEEWFEHYLEERGLEFEEHPTLPGSTKHPDYLVKGHGVEVLCEVSEIQTTTLLEYLIREAQDEAVVVDPTLDYGREQRKIADEWNDQLRPFAGDYSTAMVLAGHPDSDFDPDFLDMLETLLGNLAFGINKDSGLVEEEGLAPVFPYGLFNWHEDVDDPSTPYQFEDLSAVVVIFPDGEKVHVYLNPHAKTPFPHEIFDGPNDAVIGTTGTNLSGASTYGVIRGDPQKTRLTIEEFNDRLRDYFEQKRAAKQESEQDLGL